jgi:hypothetical protein
MAKRKVAREIWKAIPGHAGYEASSLGRIRSIDRKIRLKNRWGNYEWRSYGGRILKSPLNGSYLRVKLGHHDDGYDVHTLVMLAFVGPRPNQMVVTHRDGNGQNNKLGNLRYATYAHNYKDCVRHGNSNRGTNHYRAKLTQKAVKEIRTSKQTMKKLAMFYGVGGTTIHNARTGRNWAWVK